MWKNECSKFAPNIFNKNKCANCYRIREQHSSEALEVNKATRIVNKCGYLSVAPNWGGGDVDGSAGMVRIRKLSMTSLSYILRRKMRRADRNVSVAVAANWAPKGVWLYGST